MLIGIEATRANKSFKTGVEWYAWHVTQELKQLTVGDGNSWILYSNKLLTSGLEVLPDNWYEVRLKWPLAYGWTQLRLSYELYRHPIDVLWLPGSTLPRVTPKQTVVTVHDVGFHQYPQLYKPRQVKVHERAMREIAKTAARIITVSEFSGYAIAAAYGIEPQRIAIVPNGVNHSLYRPLTTPDDLTTIEARLRRYHISQPFFLTIGRLEAKKNLTTLIKAFNAFKSRLGLGSPHRLVLVGVPGFRYDEIKREIASSSFNTDIIELGYVPELDLPYLINAAEALIHPSLYEGFGLPPVQAMACGCPVVASEAASLPEILQDAALYFSPTEPEELAAALKRLMDELGLKANLRRAGLMRAAAYTWRATAEKTLPVLTLW